MLRTVRHFVLLFMLSAWALAAHAEIIRFTPDASGKLTHPVYRVDQGNNSWQIHDLLCTERTTLARVTERVMQPIALKDPRQLPIGTEITVVCDRYETPVIALRDAARNAAEITTLNQKVASLTSAQESDARTISALRTEVEKLRPDATRVSSVETQIGYLWLLLVLALLAIVGLIAAIVMLSRRPAQVVTTEYVHKNPVADDPVDAREKAAVFHVNGETRVFNTNIEVPGGAKRHFIYRANPDSDGLYPMLSIGEDGQPLRVRHGDTIDEASKEAIRAYFTSHRVDETTEATNTLVMRAIREGRLEEGAVIFPLAPQTSQRDQWASARPGGAGPDPIPA